MVMVCVSSSGIVLINTGKVKNPDYHEKTARALGRIVIYYLLACGPQKKPGDPGSL
jgi:hypothetical protein